MRIGIMHVAAGALLLGLAAGQAPAQEQVVSPASSLQAIPLDQITETRQRLARMKGAMAKAVEPLPDGEQRTLAAIVIETTGRCQWRADDSQAWRAAAINDTLRPGAFIRTGLNSSLTLRCGLNSTLMVDSNTRARLPRVLQDGKVLRTTVTVDRGRADIQVDRVGLLNDFSVLTPSGSLAVKGTGMGITYDGFGGTSVVGALHNRMNAIEMRYFTRYGAAWLMSGGALSSEAVPNPTLAAVVETLPPPALQAYEAEDEQSFDSAVDQASADLTSLNDTVRVVLAQDRELVTDSEITQVEQDILAALLATAEILPPDSPLEEEILEDIEVIEEIVDGIIPGDLPPGLALTGYREYFQAMQSPSDRGFLAAALVLDLVDSETPLGGQTSGIGTSVFVAGIEQPVSRRQIPLILETNLNSFFDAELTGARTDAELSSITGYASLPQSQLGNMYVTMIDYGTARAGWFDGSQIPTEADMVALAQIYQNYLTANAAAFAGNQAAARASFTSALNGSLYHALNQPTVGFTPYGNALLLQHVPGYGGGNIAIGQGAISVP